MAEECFGNNWVHMFVAEITSRIVAESGIPSDRFHLGKIILQCLKDDPDFVMQVNGATGESETNGSVLNKTIRCATSLRQMGLKKDDVLVLMAPSHLDLAIPFYAGWFLGLTIAPMDRTMNTYDLEQSFEVVKPKIIFCQSERVQDVQKAIENLGMDTKVITFDKTAHTHSLSDLLKRDEVDFQDFKVTDLDPEETIALLIPTSGTTGLPKAAALTHKNMAISGPYAWCFSTKFPSPTRSVLLAAPLQWLSTLLNFVISPILKYSRVQSSASVTLEHLYELIVKYRPTFFITSPTMLSTLVKNAEENKCDFTNFEILYVGGSAVDPELLSEIKRMSPKTIVQDTYGMSELGCLAFMGIGASPGSCGTRVGHLQYRLVDVETKEDIIGQPNKCGELWLKGPGVFKGYYNNPTATAEAFAADNWLMTGDLMYRDERWNFYFVDRIKLLLKYRNHQISPVELETVIRQHPGVLDVAVTGVPVAECGDLPVACVVPRSGCQPTAQEIKDLVKEKLSDSKQLRGGVLFMSELPLTPSTKLHRRKLKEIVMERISELELQKD